MYWYRSKRTFIALFFSGIISVASSCKPDIKETGKGVKYFDLDAYFKNESARLTKLSPLINKSVTHNGVTETKKLHVANWGTELSLFRQSDINKPAWRNSYSLLADSDLIIYKAKASEPELVTREILIKLVGGKVKYMMIVNDTYDVNARPKRDLQHYFYITREKLSYFPDSLYLIQKSQKVRFLGTNNNDIKGLFN